MRLLLFSTEFPPGPGGLGTHAYQVAKNLKSLGWDVIVLTMQDYVTKNAIEAFNESQEFQIISLKRFPFRPFAAAYRLNQARKLMTSLNPDVMLVSGDSAILLAAPFARLYQQCLAFVSHGRIPPRWQSSWWRWSYNQAKALICVSEYTRKRMTELGIKSSVTRVITNGADPSLFTILPAAEVRAFKSDIAPKDARILLTVGHVTHRKAQDVVIRALPYVLKEFPNTHYFAVGMPICKQEFVELARELGVSDHVHFPGIVDSNVLVRFMNACDVSIMVSRHTREQWEGYGIAVVEAALCGKPSIVSANSGVLESIIPGQTGLMVQEEDAVGTADAILQLLKDDDLRKKMGEAARMTALKTATWDRRVLCYDQLLREIAVSSKSDRLTAS